MDARDDKGVSLKEYAEKVKQMRDAQKQYFQTKGMPAVAKPYLEKSKALESQVDKMTQEIILNQQQGNLF